ncbi:smoothelin [Caerostris extrusa]|uniref:Smoothelin n=1 Tax=Caerostris extrusa TaxID=172846 RepID=A0AAV4XG23_CAEEX|nr:smoothelin [Caerostris extrusa]
MGEVVSETVNGVCLSSLTTEESLYNLLDATEDFDERKKVRNRLRQLQSELRAQRDEAMKKREQEREDMILQRKKDAEDSKRRMLAMYDHMAKSGVMDVNIYKNSEPSPADALPAPKRDLVEEAIQQRHKDAEERKRKILAAYDAAARSGVPGPKTADFDAINNSKSAPVTPVAKKPPADCTFGNILPKTAPNNQKMSAKAKFQQMDSVQNKQAPARPSNFRAGGGVMRSASDIKDMLLQWCKSKTREYENVEITNFSTSWNDGMAFCALIHHFYPDAFDFNALNPKNRRHNFDLAFRISEEKADIAPLLDVEDMVLMKKPDWKCVFTYVQSFYRKLHDRD